MSLAIDNAAMKTLPSRYYVSLGAFLASLGLLLFTIVDIRRGFLFTDYSKVGSPSTLLNLAAPQLVMLLAGLLGMWLSYTHLAALERDLDGASPGLKTATRLVAIVLGVFMVVDLFVYRGVPASRFLAAGRMGVGPGPLGLGRALPLDSWPGWLQPAGEGVNYLLVVWHATMLGMLLGSLFLTAGASLVTRLRSNNLTAHLTGSALSLAQPFCSCCAAPIGSALYRQGASLGPMLAFTVSAPMLNITSLVLAAALLPTEFAVLRIAGGVLVGVFLTYGVSRLGDRWLSSGVAEGSRGVVFRWSQTIASAYGRLFHFERLFAGQAFDSPAALISNWLTTAWRLARVMVPVLLIGSVLAAYLVRAMPDAGESVVGVGVMSLFGTLLMAPTWTEIPFAAALIDRGFTGLASTALIVLPAVSLPCLAIVGGAIRSIKIAALLGFAVFTAGIVAGIVFL